MAEEAASFNTSKLSISFGLTTAKVPEIGYPSTTINGFEFPLIDEAALT